MQRSSTESSPALVTALFNVRVAPSGVFEPVLAIKYRSRKLEESRASRLFGNTNAISGRERSFGVNGRQRVVLEDDARLGKICNELVHVGLRGFAMRALKIREFDQFKVLCGGAAVRAVGALLQHCAVLCKRIFTEGNDLVADDDVFSIGRCEEGKAVGLLLSRSVADQNHDPADALNLGFL